MIRARIILPDEDLRQLKAFAKAQDPSISRLLREAFRLSKRSLQRASGCKRNRATRLPKPALSRATI